MKYPVMILTAVLVTLSVASAAHHTTRVSRSYFDCRMVAVSASSMTGVTTNRIIDSH